MQDVWGFKMTPHPCPTLLPDEIFIDTDMSTMIVLFILVYYAIGWCVLAFDMYHPQSKGLWTILVWPHVLLERIYQ